MRIVFDNSVISEIGRACLIEIVEDQGGGREKETYMYKREV